VTAIPAIRRMPQVGVRAAAGLVVGAMVLGATVGNGLASEHRQLPVAVGQLTNAVIASADALACFQGVQDDLFVDTAGDTTPASVAAARRRLSTCTVSQAVAAAARISIPPAPPLEPGLWRHIRQDVVSGQAAAHRGALDVKATLAAMSADLGDRRHGADVVLAYRAAYADYVQAGAVQADATAQMRRMATGTTPSNSS
jgi:putative Ca2+/H+ antiporter (TMEM165/GDT1 family)